MAYLAEQLGDMPVSTFRNKVNENLPFYNFTERELSDLKMILWNMANDINVVTK